MAEMEHINIMDPSTPSQSLLHSVQSFDYTLLLPLLLLLLSSFFWTFLRRRGAKLPPGPRGWPVFGRIFDIRKLLSTELQDLVRKYGPIFSVRVGSVPFIVVASADLAREAFIDKASVFSSRTTPRSLAAFTSGFRTIAAGPYGPVWRALRRNLVSGLISATKASSELKNLRARVVQDLVSRLSSEASKNGGKVEVRPILRYCLYDLLLSLCFGKQVDEEVTLRVAEIQKKFLLRPRRIDDFIPWLGFLSWINRKKTEQFWQDRDNSLLPLVRDAKRSSEEGKLSADCYVATLLAMELEGQKLSDDNIVCLCSELLNGGTDTSVTAVEWALANIINRPEIQAKMAEEIESAVGKTTITEDALGKLQYLEAVVMETLRRHPPAASTLPHAVSQPCKLGGYDIPKNAVTFLSLRSISLDPRIWEDPLEFKPERFLGLDVDITGSKKLTMIPFGTGRRICPGLGLGMLHVSFILARLVQSFEWSSEAPGEKMDLTGKPEFTFVIQSPVRAIIKRR